MSRNRVEVDREKLAELWAIDSYTVTDIGNLLGCSDATVRARVKEFGLPKRSRVNRGSARRGPRDTDFVGLPVHELSGGEWVRNDRGIMVWKSFD